MRPSSSGPLARFAEADGDENPSEERVGRGKTGGLSEYAEKIHKDQGDISRLRHAAEVFQVVKPMEYSIGLIDKAFHLAAIHKADRLAIVAPSMFV